MMTMTEDSSNGIDTRNHVQYAIHYPVDLYVVMSLEKQSLR